MTEFERQMAARLQALEFLVQAIIRAQLHGMHTEEVARTIDELERQFSALSVPEDADPSFDLDELMGMHRDAQFFLTRMLRSVAPRNSDEAE
ncbi:hypothetical protein [Roseovarius indicus]|uniref:hypothetical protein n=1 Tax=Roseovarius indicus TaxID=540747 RepID=UPI0032EC292F